MTDATPIADSIPAPSTGPVPVTDPIAAAGGGTAAQHVQESPPQWNPDITAITNAQGDPTVWAKQFYELVGAVTGKWIDQDSLEQWLTAFASQVTIATHRSVFFDLANTIVPSDTKGDPALQLIQFRDDLARGFKVRAGL